MTDQTCTIVHAKFTIISWLIQKQANWYYITKCACMSISKKYKGQINALYMFRIKWLKNLFPSTVYWREKKLPVYIYVTEPPNTAFK